MNIKKQEDKEKEQKKREAAKWLAGLVEIVADDGTGRLLEGEEAIQAIIRHWEADEGK